MIPAKSAELGEGSIKLDALPDVADFRDRLFQATLIEVPPRIDLDQFKAYDVPVRFQGAEGSCTGFALSTVAHYLLRRRKMEPEFGQVSPRMFYEMAKRYDEWAGEEYDGSSARGAMKGWHKHGVCNEQLWSYQDGVDDRELTNERSTDALKRPLGAYYRVNHKDLVTLHTAIAEVGILFATAEIHAGWMSPDVNGIIGPQSEPLGGHAFAIVGYNAHGFWVQNSWSDGWGIDGCALLTYDDWLDSAMDVWVARLGVPIKLATATGTAVALSGKAQHGQPQPLDNVRPFIISVGADGRLRSTGTYATAEYDLQRIFAQEIPGRSYDWTRKRLLLYAHGGLLSDSKQLERTLDLATTLVDEEIYLLTFHWNADYLQTLQSTLMDALSRRTNEEQRFDRSREFMADRLDSALEPLVRSLSGKLVWDDLKARGLLANKNQYGAGRIFLRYLRQFLDTNPEWEVHCIAHSAGSVFLAPLIQLMTASTEEKLPAGPMKGRTGHAMTIESCSLWAPLTSIKAFRQSYLPPIEEERVKRFTLFTLSDRVERDDSVANIYQKSLPYLVAHALEEHPSIPILSPGGEPLLGLTRDVSADVALTASLFESGLAQWIVAPNGHAIGTAGASAARTHLDFETDPATIRSALARMSDGA